MTITAAPSDLVYGYAPTEEDRPLAAYAALMAVFGASLTGALTLLRASGRELPERPRAGDLLLTAVATHKISRLLAKDRVTSAMRPSRVTSRQRDTAKLRNRHAERAHDSPSASCSSAPSVWRSGSRLR